MRFMVIVKATEDSENGVMPDEKLLADMGKFNEELVVFGEPGAPPRHTKREASERGTAPTGPQQNL